MNSEWAGALRDADVAGLRRQLDAGTGVNALDRYNQTGLMIAAVRGHAEVVRLLIERGADLNHAAKYGLTALMLAVLNGHTEVVRLLVEAGAALDPVGSGAPGFAGKTALDLALARGDRALAEIIARPTR